MSNVSTTTAAIYQAVLDSLNSSGECGVLPPAPPGKSAYEVAVDNGFVGSEKQWLDSLTLEQENEIARLEARILANENYNKDSNNAASRKVGLSPNNLVENQSARKAVYRTIDGYLSTPEKADFDSFDKGTFYLATSSGNNGPKGLGGFVSVLTMDNYGSGTGLQFAYGYALPGMAIRRQYAGSWSPWVNYYHTENIKKDSNTNLLLETGTSIPSNSAASRLVGTATGQVPVYTANGISGLGIGTNKPAGLNESDLSNLSLLGGIYNVTSLIDDINLRATSMLNIPYAGAYACQMFFKPDRDNIYYRRVKSGGPTTTGELYTSLNTTKDTATGFIKASSPVLHVYNDNITKIHEAEQLDITVVKKGTGHYEIHGTTGLRKNDGWFMSPPRDVHGNVLCMVDLEEKEGVVILKTYKKLFDFETVSIVHDYDNPMDIPEGVCVEFRFNDLPQEELEVPEPVDEPIVEEEVEPEVVEEGESVVNEPEVVEEPVVEEEVPVEEEPEN